MCYDETLEVDCVAWYTSWGLGAMEDSWLGLHNYGRKSSILAKGG